MANINSNEQEKSQVEAPFANIDSNEQEKSQIEEKAANKPDTLIGQDEELLKLLNAVENNNAVDNHDNDEKKPNARDLKSLNG